MFSSEMLSPHAQSLPDYKELMLSLAPQAAGRDFSVSYSANGAYEERDTLYFTPTPGLILRLARVAALLGMAPATIAAWRASLAGADAIFLTVACSGQDVRLYSQHLDRHLDRVAAGDLSDFTIYHGFKSYGARETRHDLYRCTPLARPEIYAPALKTSLAAFGITPASITALLAALSPETMIFAQIEGAGRRSWLATLREAAIAPARTAAWLAPLGARAPALHNRLAQAPVLHLAGGEDPRKGLFLTVYLEEPSPQGAF